MPDGEIKVCSALVNSDCQTVAGVSALSHAPAHTGQGAPCSQPHHPLGVCPLRRSHSDEWSWPLWITSVFYSLFISMPDAIGQTFNKYLSKKGEREARRKGDRPGEREGGREGGKGRRGCLLNWFASASEPRSQQAPRIRQECPQPWGQLLKQRSEV